MQPLDADPGEITALLRALGKSSPEAKSRLYELLYAELRRIAAAHMRAERKDHTLTPTALVHEAWLRLGDNQTAFENRQHFLAIAATAMRRILVDYARSRNADCRGGTQKPASLDALFNLQAPMADETVLALDEALQRLEIMSERAAKVIEMRFFAGLTESEVATVLGVNRRTVNRDWEMARVWLYSELHDTSGAKRADQH